MGQRHFLLNFSARFYIGRFLTGLDELTSAFPFLHAAALKQRLTSELALVPILVVLRAVGSAVELEA